MIKKSRKELLKRLNDLQDIMTKKTDSVLCLSLEDWIESDVQGTFNDYIHSKVKGYADATVIVDDMLLDTPLYVPMEFIFDTDKDTLMTFVKAASDSDEKKFMELYIKVFDEMFADKDVKANEGSFYQDFMEHYKTMSIEKLVERYEDQRFFRMPWI